MQEETRRFAAWSDTGEEFEIVEYSKVIPRKLHGGSVPPMFGRKSFQTSDREPVNFVSDGEYYQIVTRGIIVREQQFLNRPSLNEASDPPFVQVPESQAAKVFGALRDSGYECKLNPESFSVNQVPMQSIDGFRDSVDWAKLRAWLREWSKQNLK
jgi:hypothetical protein